MGLPRWDEMGGLESDYRVSNTMAQFTGEELLLILSTVQVLPQHLPTDGIGNGHLYIVQYKYRDRRST